MKMVFTECDYSGNLEFGGRLSITAENAPEVQALIEHFKLFKDSNNVAELQRRIEALQSETLSHLIGTDKRPIYEVDSCLDHEFTAPYEKWARDCLGYDEQLPDIEIPLKWRGLRYTYYASRIYLQHGHICFNAFTSSEPRNRMTAHEYAFKSVIDYIGEEFGTRYHEPEFSPSRNGHYVKNPNYLKRHAAKPGATNARLKRAIFDWWHENRANDMQREIVAGNRKVAANADYMDCFRFERHKSHIYYAKTAKDYKTMSFAEFAALGGES